MANEVFVTKSYSLDQATIIRLNYLARMDDPLNPNASQKIRRLVSAEWARLLNSPNPVITPDQAQAIENEIQGAC